MADVGHLPADPSHRKVALLIAVLALMLSFAETLAKGARPPRSVPTSKRPTCGPFFRPRRYG